MDETVPGIFDMLNPLLNPPMLLKFRELRELNELKVTDPAGCPK